jgi:hypothetical protein
MCAYFPPSLEQVNDSSCAAEFASITGLRNTIVRFHLRPNISLDRLPTAAAIVFTVIALLSVLSYWGFRSRIPLAALLLQVVMDVSKHHKSVYVVAFTALVFQGAVCV